MVAHGARIGYLGGSTVMRLFGVVLFRHGTESFRVCCLMFYFVVLSDVNSQKELITVNNCEVSNIVLLAA